MSLPDQIQRQLFGLPARLAGRAGTFTEGRANAGLAGPVLTGPLTRSVDVLQPRSIGSDLKLSMSAGNASLGHACVSPARVEDHSTRDGSENVQNLFAGSANGHG